MEDKNIYLCNSNNNYSKLNPYSLTPIIINNIEYPSVIIYIYSELLCFNKEKIKLFNIINKFSPPKELDKKFDSLFEQCNKKLLKDAIILAYKMKISQENDCKKELLIFEKSVIDRLTMSDDLKKIIIEIILNIKNEVENNINIQNMDEDEINNNNKIFEIYRVNYALNNIMSDGYDIKELIGLNSDKIKTIFLDTDSDELSPLFFKKKILFNKYYNSINNELIDEIANQYHILPENFIYIKDELKHPGNLVQLLRKKNIVPSPLGVEKSQDFNTLLKMKVKKLLVNTIQENLYDTTHKIDDELVEKIYEYYKDDKLKLDPHFIKFIQELEKQHIEDDEIEDLRLFKISLPEEYSHDDIISEKLSDKQDSIFSDEELENRDIFLNPIFKELNDSDNEEEIVEIIENCLSPYHMKIFTINNKYYPSIIHYIILVKMAWYSNMGLDYCYKLLFKNGKKVYSKKNKKLNTNYINNINNFKNISTLKSKMNEMYQNRKIILAKDANYHKFVSKKSNIGIQNMLLSTYPKNLIYNSSDIILGNGTLNNGLNIIGKNMEDLRSLLIKNEDKIQTKKIKVMNNIYSCGSNEFLNKWFLNRLKDIIRTVIIFSKYFNIEIINPDIIDYIIKNIYLPCKNIYLTYTSHSNYPKNFEKLCAKLINKYSQKYEYNGTAHKNSFIKLWIIASCLCSYATKNIENNGKEYIKDLTTQLTSKYSKNHLTILKAIKSLEKIFNQYDEKDQYDYLPSIASIISGKKFNIKKINQHNVKNIMNKYHIIKNYAEAIEWIYNTDNVNRINFFIPN